MFSKGLPSLDAPVPRYEALTEYDFSEACKKDARQAVMAYSWHTHGSVQQNECSPNARFCSMYCTEVLHNIVYNEHVYCQETSDGHIRFLSVVDFEHILGHLQPSTCVHIRAYVECYKCPSS